jgi:hypothetical protein
MMRFGLPSKLPAAATAAGVTRTSLTKINKRLVDGINAAHAELTNNGAICQKWFGAADLVHRATVLAAMNRMVVAANGHATITLAMKAEAEYGANSNAYVWPQGTRARDGQFILNLGSGFGTVYSSPTIALKLATGDGQALKTIAHELAHLLFGANQAPDCPVAYRPEQYREAALVAATNDVAHASWNADNYGYFIEACAP